MWRLALFLLWYTFFPFEEVHAIPPPDLLISTTQAILASLGVFLSFLIVWWVQFRTWIQTRKNKWHLYAIGLCVILLCIVGSQFMTIRDWVWRKSIDTELSSLWEEYEQVYSADSESEARISLLNRDHETTWKNFMKVVDGGEYLVIDIRDIYGYESGRIPGSIHMRFGDLINGKWEEIAAYKDTPIYVVCFLGSTGALTINFLEDKGFTKLYQPILGIRQAVRSEPDLPFEGTLEAFGRVKQTRMLTNYEAYENIFKIDGLQVIDMRAPSHYINKTPITPHHKLFREFMTIPEIDDFISTLDVDGEYLALCDSSASCYQGELLFEDFERRGLKMHGVYDVTDSK